MGGAFFSKKKSTAACGAARATRAGPAVDCANNATKYIVVNLFAGRLFIFVIRCIYINFNHTNLLP
jgi:hypothetical protein